MEAGKVQPQDDDNDETPQKEQQDEELRSGAIQLLRVQRHELTTRRPAAPTVFTLAARDERTRGTAKANGIHGSASSSSSSSSPAPSASSRAYSPSSASSSSAIASLSTVPFHLSSSVSSASSLSQVYLPSKVSSSTPATPASAAVATPSKKSLTNCLKNGLKNNLTPAGVRSTRSRPSPLYISHEWEALDIQQSRQAVVNMSRNRPRGGPATRENGLAADEEVEMWNKICQDIRKAAEKNEKQKAIGLQIAALNEKIAKNGSKPSLAEIDQLDSLHRQQLKLSEEERAILQDEPADVTKNLGILIALRSASEADPQSRSISQNKSRKRKGDVDLTSTESPGPSSSGVSDKLNRIKNSTQRSTSVSSSQRENTASLDNGVEGTRPSATEKGDQLVPGAEVVFKHNKKQQGTEGEGIQCIIKNITGEGNKRRYDVQDPEPIENGEEGYIYKTTAASLIPIPKAGTPLPQFQLGKQVLARYPDTTTFYRAEVMGLKKDVYRLKFEGEEDDKEMEVDRRYVLDIPNK